MVRFRVGDIVSYIDSGREYLFEITEDLYGSYCRSIDGHTDMDITLEHNLVIHRTLKT